MKEFWEAAFTEKMLMWGLEPSASALLARDHFGQMGVEDVLMPGIGYGRNAKPFLDQGMSVTGIEISESVIALARTQFGLQVPIYHGSVANMPFPLPTEVDDSPWECSGADSSTGRGKRVL